MTAALRRGVGALLAVVTVLGSGACGALGGARATVTVLASWGDGSAEAEQFRTVARAYADAHGFDIEYKGVREVNSVLRVELASGSPPDIAMPSSPAALAAYAESGQLVRLDDDTAEAGQLLRDARDPRHAYGVVLKTSLKSMVWRDAATAGAPPRTWDDLLALSRAAREAKTTPWCLGMGSGAQSGWPGTDWVEDILLHQSGPAAYAAWSEGRLPWTSPEVTSAWTAWARLLGESGMADAAAARRALLTTWSDAVKQPCAMEHQASFARDVWRGAGRDPAFFLFPPFADAAPGVVTGVDVAGLFTDQPQARDLLRYLASRAGQEAWVKEAGGGFFSPRTDLDRAAVYGPESGIERQIADRLATAPQRCVDASDFMPTTVADAFSAAVLEFLSDPEPARLTPLLRGLDQARASTTTGWLASPCGAAP